MQKFRNFRQFFCLNSDCDAEYSLGLFINEVHIKNSIKNFLKVSDSSRSPSKKCFDVIPE